MPLVLGCRAEPGQPSSATVATGSIATDSAEPDPAPLPSRVLVESGKFEAGTEPGAFNRIPELEPALRRVELGSYQIDVLPHPNTPGSAPTWVESVEEAARLCDERGARLCTELEWERACKGPDSTPFSTGAEWNCPDPTACTSGFGARGLGALPEWTSSRFGTGSERAGTAVVRGAAVDEAPALHRCARRSGSTKRATFRCCHGAPNATKVEEPGRDRVYAKAELEPERLRELLAAHPRTEALATENLQLFAEPEAARTVIDRGPGDRKGFQFTVAPLHWTPVPGARFLAATGRSGERTSFVVVFYDLGRDRYSLASSFVMHDEPGPVAFAYSEGIEPRFHFSTCWGCPGETGKVLYRTPDRAVVLQP